jgi:serine/threonine protein kinase
MFETFEKSHKIWIAMDLVPGGELFNHLAARGALTEADCAKVMRDVCAALSHLHAMSIVHRDLKPENLLFVDPPGPGPIGRLKLADYGFARTVPAPSEGPMRSLCGTLGYAAPEIMRGRGYASEMCDMWSAGVLLYECVSGKEAFKVKGECEAAQFFELAPPLSFRHKIFEKVGKSCKELIRGECAG